MTSGRWTTPSSRLFPQNRPRANTNAVTSPNGRLPSIAQNATRRLSRTALISSALNSITIHDPCRPAESRDHRATISALGAVAPPYQTLRGAWCSRDGPRLCAGGDENATGCIGTLFCGIVSGYITDEVHQ